MGLLWHRLVHTYYMQFSVRTFVPVIAALKPGRTLVNRLFATPLRPFGTLMSSTPHNRCTWLHGARETPTGSTWLHGARYSLVMAAANRGFFSLREQLGEWL